MVEFGISLLPLMAMVFILIDLAWVVLAWASVQEAVREGVRFAVTGSTGSYSCQDAAIKAVVEQYSFGFVNASNVNSVVNITYYAPSNLSTPVTGLGSNRGGNVVKIGVTRMPVNLLGALWFSNTPIKLSAASSDIMEGSPYNTPPCR